MKNYVQKGDILRLTVPADTVAGDPVVVGTIAGVCVTDRDTTDGKAEVRVTGVCSLTVTGKNNAGNVAVAEGDKLYKDGTEINKDATNGDLFGKSLGAVSSGASATVNVLLVQA